MIFTLDNIVNSIAGVLKRGFDYPVYSSPGQQISKLPCFFIFFMPSSIDGQIGNRCLRDLGLDIIFVQERNSLGAYDEINAMVDYLDENVTRFKYSDGNESCVLNVSGCEWKIENGELHYQFHIKVRVSTVEQKSLMERMDYEGGLRIDIE